MTDSGQRLGVENVAAPEPTGDGQTTAMQLRWALCALCGHGTSEPTLIGTSESNSGPGHALYADPTCARAYANTSSAPEWLRESFPGAA